MNSLSSENNKKLSNNNNLRISLTEIKNAAQKGQNIPPKLAGINNNPPKAYNANPTKIPDL